MAGLSAEQRNDYYLSEAIRTGVHKSILAALYAAQRQPQLQDGEMGLGIAPANRIPLHQVDTFPQQVEYAANTVRSLTDKLTAQGWKGSEIWNSDQGSYTDRFLQAIANGYMPPASDPTAARLEVTRYETLRQAYLDDLTQDLSPAGVAPPLQFLDPALLKFVERLPRYYLGLSYQREALLDAVRLWRKQTTRLTAIASLLRVHEASSLLNPLDETTLDQPLLQFSQQIAPFYSGYPHQREALLRLVQLWRQLESREAAIASLQADPGAEADIQLIDPALIAFIQRLPQSYQRKGEQRNALTETFRLWRKLETRTIALQELGIDPQVLTASNPNRNALINAAAQLDRSLIEFVKRIPIDYEASELQREALIRLIQLWRGLEARDKTVDSLFDDLRRMERSRPGSPDAPPPPEPAPLPPRPSRWTPATVQLHLSIIPNGSFTWADATQGGIHQPPNQATVEAIVRIADLAQQACAHLGRPLRIVTWYRSPDPQATRFAPERYSIGDAIQFYCDGLSGKQLYLALDPWWTGGLGRYTHYPQLCHIDARGYRARWIR